MPDLTATQPDYLGRDPRTHRPLRQPVGDSARVLGQIARGEVRADAGAAREIAARHEAAYGAVWDQDRAWAEALAGVL